MLAIGSAYAASPQTANLNVTAAVAANCTIATAPVAFGNYDPVVTNASTALTAAGSVTIACTKGSAPAITLGLGAQPSGTIRRMLGGGDFLSYELYQPSTTAPDAASTCSYVAPTVWGTTAAQTFTPTSPSNVTARAYKVCGSVPAAQNVTVAASYADVVVASVNF
ncbi:MAG: spore coat protein U domain-containing protein [Aromatoleum sp.]|nr:spore coat protein U domain-containing protein [Aromatoleum sp.]